MKNIPVIVFGTGNVGRTLVQQIVDSHEIVAGRNHFHFNIVALVDSRGWQWHPVGLDDNELQNIIADKQAGRPLSEDRPDQEEVLRQLVTAGIERAIVVDTTAADGMEPVIDMALELDFSVAMANKKPLTGPWPAARRYYNHPKMRYESTVGGGQPVIATLRYLRDTNDQVFSIEGQLSGTLGYICGRLDEGASFSGALAEAKARGYTEPDPREDLGGLDVKRKIMILGRLAGWPLEEDDIQVEPLYHPSLAHLSVAEFMESAIAMDPVIGDRIIAAGHAGQVLRYIARVSQQGGAVGLSGLSPTSPLANLKYINFRTARYDDEPLMIAGKGAGLEMTAAGVLGDMIALVRETY